MMISPSLRVSQGPPNPFQNALPGVGPRTVAPVALSNTSKVTFTHWTNWVAPTAPLVSGGTNGPPLATVSCALMPSKLSPRLTPSGPDGVLAAGSDCEETNGARVGWASCADCDPADFADFAVCISSRRGLDRSCLSSCVTSASASVQLGAVSSAIRESARNRDTVAVDLIHRSLNPC